MLLSHERKRMNEHESDLPCWDFPSLVAEVYAHYQEETSLAIICGVPPLRQSLNMLVSE